jgi:hypothetical protein
MTSPTAGACRKPCPENPVAYRKFGVVEERPMIALWSGVTSYFGVTGANRRDLTIARGSGIYASAARSSGGGRHDVQRQVARRRV